MIKIIKDSKGYQLQEPEQKFVLQLIDESMYEVENFREATAVIVGADYLDCETAETEWLMRLDVAKKIGLFIISNEEDTEIIVYDERIGKIPYSYTTPNPNYDLPKDPELIRIENDKTFILTLIKIRYIKLFEKTDEEYKNILKTREIQTEIGEELKIFKDKIQNIPLHKHIETKTNE